jgi:hypothetical protein
MKRRSGLVSNSSSSSFMCTFGKIIDKELFSTWCKENNLAFHTIKGEELATAPNWEIYESNKLSGFFQNLDGDFFDYMPSTKEIARLAEKDPEATYVISGGWGYGDDSFYWNEDYEEYDYDKVYEDDFPKEVEALGNAGKKQGFQMIKECCYAGRDG